MKIGIDLGGSHIAIGVIDDKGYIVEKIEKRLLSKDKSTSRMFWMPVRYMIIRSKPRP